ncbi:hypothetical protein [Nocardia rhizosphaerae]|uniref:Uncharacterized protein n=1 Tax=Nocardia rhizosphaerae TaxID=1691571 RepID=A0ABV8KZI6_9NOCA
MSAVAGLLVGRETAGLAWNWVFSMLGGLPIFAPGIVATLLGGIRLGDRYTKIVTALGSILLPAAAVTIADGVEENLHLDAADGPRFVAILSPAELLVFTLPYALIVLGCLVTGRQLWIAFRAVTPDACEHTSTATPPITPRRW